MFLVFEDEAMSVNQAETHIQGRIDALEEMALLEHALCSFQNFQQFLSRESNVYPSGSNSTNNFCKIILSIALIFFSLK